ncbi:MAG: leucine-rich repeat domain-containing protein [Oscillospiraceae bacterium]|nr:leucine-rich repeat domain-containing protein [Oscillospiraceae bacterium]
MGFFTRKSADKLKYRNKEMVERGEFRGAAVQELDMPDSVRIVGESGFRECRSLHHVKLSNTLCELGAFAFRDCDALENILMPGEMRYPDGSAGSLGIGCFEGCGLLREITIPNGVAVLPTNLFHNCAALEHVILPKSITAIHSGAFAGCARLKTIEMPTFPEMIAIDAFHDTPHQDEIAAKRKPVLTIMHTTSYSLPRIFQFCAASRLIGTEQSSDEMSIILDAVTEDSISFRITNYTQAGGRHTVSVNKPTRLFYQEYDCNGRAGLQKEEILASYR